MLRVPRRVLPLPAALFGALLVVYALTAARGAVSVDVWSADLVSWSIGTTGSPLADLDAFPTLADNDQRGIWVVERPDGREVVGRSPGAVAAAVPAYWIAGLLGGEAMSIVPGGLTAALLVAAAVTILFTSLRPRLGDRVALAASLLFGLTTPVWSVAADGMWPHTVTILGIVGMAWAADRERWWLVGLFGGVTLWGRLHAVVICAVLGLLLAWWRRDPRIAARIGLVSGVLLGLMTLWTRWIYGRWNPTAAYDTAPFVDNASRGPLDVIDHLAFWVSPGRGLLVWTPVILLLLPALVRAWRTLPDWSRALLLAGLGYTLLQLTLSPAKGGEGFFGYRVGLELLACATPALALSAHRMGSAARRLLAPVAVIQLAVLGLGALSRPETAPAISNRWDSNELVARLADQTAYTTILLATLALLGAVGVRMWHDPGLWREEAEHERV